MRPFFDFIRAHRVSLGAPLAALLVSLAAGTRGDRTAFALALGAVIVSAFFEGRKGGVFATGLAAGFLLIPYHLLPPEGRGPVDFGLSLGLFAAVGLLAASLSGECRGALHASARYRDALAHLPDAVLLADGEGRVAYANEVAAVLTGIPAAEAAGQPVEQVAPLLDEESRRPLKDPLHRPAGVAWLAGKGGTETLIEYRADVLAGNLRLLTFRDVGERRGAEADLRRREEQFRALAARAPVGVLFLDPAGDCLFSNAACQALGGFTAAEGAGRGWARRVHPEDQAAVGAWLAAVRQAKPFAAEFRFQTPDGAARWVRLRSDVALSDRGKPLGAVGTLVDVTDHKELGRALAEQRQAGDDLRRRQRESEDEHQRRVADLENTRDLLQRQLAEQRDAHDRRAGEWRETEGQLRKQATEQIEARQRLESQLAERQHGEGRWREKLTRAQEEKRRLEERLRQQAAEMAEAKQALQKQLAGQAEAQQRLENQLAERQAAEEGLRRELAQGREDWKRAEEQLYQELARLEAARGQIDQELAAGRGREEALRQELDRLRAERERIGGELRDVTDRLRQADEWRNELARQGETARAAEALLDRLPGVCLPALAALDEEVRNGKAYPGLQSSLTRIEDQTCRLRGLLHGVELARRIGRDDLSPVKEPVEATAVIDRALELAGWAIQSHGKQVTVTLPLAPAWLPADPDLLAHALAALLDNAARHAEPDGPVRLTAEHRPEEILFRVQNPGRGLTPDEATALLSLDAHARRYRQGDGDGLGLGLALAHSLVKLHGGRLTATGGPEGGSEFVLHVPALPRQAPAESPATTDPVLLPFRAAG